MAMRNEEGSTGITIPPEEELFRQIMLTVENVWGNKLSSRDVEKWLSNFGGLVFSLDYERRLALYLLANFVYYNDAEVRHLCKTLFNEFLHWVLLHEDPQIVSNIEAALDLTCYTSRFYPWGRLGESGAYVLYYFRQANNIPINYISDPDLLPVYVKYVVYIDDVVISGTQANQYLRLLTHKDQDRKIILLTFLATEEAIALLKSNNIQVISCIILDERSKCFSQSSNLFRDFKGDFENCKNFAVEYGKLSLRYQPGVCSPLGYMNGQYAFGFFYNTPDNTLPIFWADNQGWSPIMKRYEKYSGDFHYEHRRFV